VHLLVYYLKKFPALVQNVISENGKIVICKTFKVMCSVRYVISKQHIEKNFFIFFNRCTLNFEIYAVYTPIYVLFINLVKSSKFTLKYTVISILHVSFFNDHHQGALSVPG